MRIALLSLALASTASLAHAQIEKPPLSPRAVVKQQIGLSELTLDYSRPGVRGRAIFGELEPYGVVWRTGANASTKVTFTEPVTFGGEEVPAGRYGLYAIPGKDSWTVILSKNAELWGAGGYDPKDDQVRVVVEPVRLENVVETLTIDLERFTSSTADLFIAWENVKVVVPLAVDTDSRVLAAIDERVRKAEGEVSGRTYFDAAMYLYEKGTNLEEALGWMDQAVEKSLGAFWMKYYQAELALKLGKTEKARAAAVAAEEEAKASERGDFGYGARARILIEKIDALK